MGEGCHRSAKKTLMLNGIIMDIQPSAHLYRTNSAELLVRLVFPVLPRHRFVKMKLEVSGHEEMWSV